MTREQPTIVIWHGQYSTDGKERLKAMKDRECAYPGLRNLRLVGQSGDWWLVADAASFEPKDGYMDVQDWHARNQLMVSS